MRVPEKPGCGIDWRRLFTLPVGVPPESLPDARRLEYLRELDVSADTLFNTFDRFGAQTPRASDARAAPVGDPAPVLLPFAANPAGSEPHIVPADATNIVGSGPFHPTPPAPGNAAQVEAELQARLPRDEEAARFTPIPIPFAGVDTIRFYFAEKQLPGFDGTLGLVENGLILPGNNIAAALPAALLTTRPDTPGLGEVDRLILRAPVTGRFRFEPYYIYRGHGAAFQPVGPSTTGRLVVQQPHRPPNPKDTTDMQVFQERLFAFEHVERESVVPMIHRSLMLQLAFFDGFERQFRGVGGANRLRISKETPAVFGWVVSGVSHLLRSWTAYLSVLRWRPEDTAVNVPAIWRTLFPAHVDKPVNPATEAKALVPIVAEILGTPARRESLLFFSAEVYSPLLAGYTWLEVLTRNQQQNARRFPVTADVPPFTPPNAAEAEQHQRLRFVEAPQFRWVACYAGCPVGKPARVYAPAAAVGETTFPANGLTTYEVEALHAAGTAAAALGVPPPVGVAGPQPGRAMDLAHYAAKRTGHACFFHAQRLASDPLHTAVDFFLEVTRGIHARQKENGFLDLRTFENPATGEAHEAHPLVATLHHDEHHKAEHLRRQMDSLLAPIPGVGSLGLHSRNWWQGKLNLILPPPFSLTPIDPYRTDRTTFRRRVTIPGQLTFGDLIDNPIPSGFGTFDLESAYLACGRMRQAAPPGGEEPGSQLPLPVLLALMQTEGIKSFAPLNRIVKNTTTASETLVWEVIPRTPGDPDSFWQPMRENDPPNGEELHARKRWLAFPYGLDTFAETNTENDLNIRVDDMAIGGVFNPEAGENLAQYIQARIYSDFIVVPEFLNDLGLRRIWKRSRRMHWAALSLMVSFFRYLETLIHNPTLNNRFATLDWEANPAWLIPPPDVTNKTPTDVEWKDYLTYYALIYIAYNGGPNPWDPASPNTWVELVRGAEENRPGLWAHTLRDYLLFQHERAHPTIRKTCRFVVALDAFLRLNLMEGRKPGEYAAQNARNAALPANRWGL